MWSPCISEFWVTQKTSGITTACLPQRAFSQLVSPQFVVSADEKNRMNFCGGRSGERTSVPADAGLPEASPHWGCGQGAPHLHRSHRSNVPRSLQALQQASIIPNLTCLQCCESVSFVTLSLPSLLLFVRIRMFGKLENLDFYSCVPATSYA